jgi:hypothetical protein
MVGKDRQQISISNTGDADVHEITSDLLIGLWILRLHALHPPFKQLVCGEINY